MCRSPSWCVMRQGRCSAIRKADWFSIDVIWLPTELRGRGLGAQLIADAEVEARRRGCVGVRLNTGSFQAPGFYERLGYEVCGVLEDFPLGHRRLTFSKRLNGITAAGGGAASK